MSRPPLLRRKGDALARRESLHFNPMRSVNRPDLGKCHQKKLRAKFDKFKTVVEDFFFFFSKRKLEITHNLKCIPKNCKILLNFRQVGYVTCESFEKNAKSKIMLMTNHAILKKVTDFKF